MTVVAARPQVSVYNVSGQVSGSVELPEVFTTAVRLDLINFVHTNMAKNARQAYAVSMNSGYQTSAQSWGTGRAVARIPRVAGGGTHRSGQAAFGNMCRGGGMFAPTRTWRRWHRSINVTQKRYALASALAASSVAALVMARGHKCSAVAEIPIVVEDEAVSGIKKTKEAIAFLQKIGCGEDLLRCSETRKRRTGTAGRRNRVHQVRRGPLIIVSGNTDQARAFRNIPGIEIGRAECLNLLQVAPGGTVGRLIVYTKSAMEVIKATPRETPKAVVTSTDIRRIINSDEIQSVLRARKTGTKAKFIGATNGLKSQKVIERLALKKF